MVGVTDLKATLDIPVRNPEGKNDESKFYEAVSKMIATSKDTGIPLMIPAFRMNPDDVDWLRNFKMVVTSVDILNVVKGHRQNLAAMKEALSTGQQNGYHKGQ